MENIDPNSTNPSEGYGKFTDDVKNFYTGKFPALLSKFFRNPLHGLRAIFEKSTEQGLMNSIILYASVFVLFFLGSFILYKNISFGGAFRSGLSPVLMMVIISGISFGIKSISGTPNFKSELLTGALCGIPMIFYLVFQFVLKIFGGNLMGNIMRMEFTAWLSISVMLYIFIMLVNVLQQSLLAAKTKDTFAWYVAPAGIILSMFITFRLMF